MELETISHICMVAGIFMLAITAIIYIKLDIYKAWSILMGKQIKGRKEEKARHRNAERHKAVHQKVYTGEGESTDRLSPSDMPDYKQPVYDKPESGIEILYEITYMDQTVDSEIGSGTFGTQPHKEMCRFADAAGTILTANETIREYNNKS